MEAASFAQVAANKLSVQLNLKHPRGIELAKQLIAKSDIMCESFRPGVMERLGLGYDALKAVKEDIVMVSISACGQTGPERNYSGYAPLFGATGGLGTLTGFEDGPPVEMRHVMDHGTGLTATAATLAACFRKKRTGKGQHVDLAAREVATSFIGDALLQFAATGKSPGRQGNDAPAMAPHNVYPCEGRDAWVSIAVAQEPEWTGLVKALGRPEWLSTPRFADAVSRWQHRHELDREIAAWTRTRTREQVTQLLQSHGVAAFPSYNAQDIVDDPHMQSRGAIVDLSSWEGESRKVVGVPWRFSRTPGALDTWTPKLGQHNEYVFGELLGLNRTEIDALVEQEVIY
jgi:crotonobetainyl-CoA:carnitine CoA-transferase CaiB-like acyl-CoA transferase